MEDGKQHERILSCVDIDNQRPCRTGARVAPPLMEWIKWVIATKSAMLHTIDCSCHVTFHVLLYMPFYDLLLLTLPMF